METLKTTIYSSKEDGIKPNLLGVSLMRLPFFLLTKIQFLVLLFFVCCTPTLADESLDLGASKKLSNYPISRVVTNLNHFFVSGWDKRKKHIFWEIFDYNGNSTLLIQKGSLEDISTDGNYYLVVNKQVVSLKVFSSGETIFNKSINLTQFKSRPYISISAKFSTLFGDKGVLVNIIDTELEPGYPIGFTFFDLKGNYLFSSNDFGISGEQQASTIRTVDTNRVIINNSSVFEKRDSKISLIKTYQYPYYHSYQIPHTNKILFNYYQNLQDSMRFSIWDFLSGEIINIKKGFPETIRNPMFSDDGELFIYTNGNRLFFLNIKKSFLKRLSFPNNGRVIGYAFHHENKDKVFVLVHDFRNSEKKQSIYEVDLSNNIKFKLLDSFDMNKRIWFLKKNYIVISDKKENLSYLKKIKD